MKPDVRKSIKRVPKKVLKQPAKAIKVQKAKPKKKYFYPHLGTVK